MIFIIHFSDKKKESLEKFSRNNWYVLRYKIYVFEIIDS